MDGDVGHYDAPVLVVVVCVLDLRGADTVLILDFSLVRCAWRAVRRSHERADFWWWLLTWRHRSRASLLRPEARRTDDEHGVRIAELPEPGAPPS